MAEEDKLGTPTGDAAEQWLRKPNPTEPGRLLDIDTRQLYSFAVTIYKRESLHFGRERYFNATDKPFYEVLLSCRDYEEGDPVYEGYSLFYGYTFSEDGGHLKRFDTEPPKEDIGEEDSTIIDPEELKIVREAVDALKDKLTEVTQPPAPQS